MSFCVEALSGHCVYPSAKGDVPDVVRRWPPWRRHFSLAQTPQCLACRAAPVSLASLRNRRHGAGAAVDALSGRIQSGVAGSLTRFFSCTSLYRTVLATSPSVRFTCLQVVKGPAAVSGSKGSRRRTGLRSFARRPARYVEGASNVADVATRRCLSRREPFMAARRLHGGGCVVSSDDKRFLEYPY